MEFCYQTSSLLFNFYLTSPHSWTWGYIDTPTINCMGSWIPPLSPPFFIPVNNKEKTVTLHNIASSCNYIYHTHSVKVVRMCFGLLMQFWDFSSIVHNVGILLRARYVAVIGERSKLAREGEVACTKRNRGEKEEVLKRPSLGSQMYLFCYHF